MGEAWDHWYHVTGSTYGAWLPGDPRGFRTRHHREHVEGDYKTPPPEGEYDWKHKRSMSLTKRDPVRLISKARRLARDAMAEALGVHGAKVAALAVGATHYHILARFPEDNPRHVVGLAKKRSARALSDAGLAARGGVWAVRSRALPINDRAHARAARAYILRHASRGAAVFPESARPQAVG